MPDYYKPQHLLDFEDRLPSSAHGSDSLSLNSFNSATSTNLEWDDSAIAPSSEGKWLQRVPRALNCWRAGGVILATSVVIVAAPCEEAWELQPIEETTWESALACAWNCHFPGLLPEKRCFGQNLFQPECAACSPGDSLGKWKDM